MNTLDKDRIQYLIEFLQHASAAGYSSLSSPMEILLEAGTDILLLIKKSLLEGRKAIRRNPELIFSRTKVDSLGNPLQIRLSKDRRPWQIDQDTAEYLGKVASFLVAIKRRQSFSDALTAAELTVARPLVDASTKKSVEVTLNLKQKRLEFRKKNSKQQAYYRRQRNKRSTLL